MIETPEFDRLSTLESYRILDSQPDELLDEIARIAAGIFNVKSAAISLVDDHRQWFKARCGFARTETPIVESICRHTIQSDDVLIIPDAAVDQRCEDNPLVHNSHEVGFYVGAPLISKSGHRLGALCVFDPLPKTPRDWQVEALKNLASVVMRALDVHKAGMEFRWREEYLLHLADRSPGGLFEFARDSQGKQWLSFASAGILDAVGVTPADATADIANVFARVHPDDAPALSESIKEAYEKRASWQHEFRIEHPEKGTVWLLGTSEPQTEMRGLVTWQGCLVDITESVLERERLAATTAEVQQKNRALTEYQILLDQIGGMSQVGGCVIDLETAESHCTPAMYAIHEVDPDYKPAIMSAVEFADPEYRAQLRDTINAAIRGESVPEIEYPITTAKGHRRWIRSRAFSALAEDGRVVRLILSLQNITAEHELLQNARYAADHDFLTGLPNRRHFFAQLDEIITHSEPSAEHALFFFDLDYFKDINDSLGYETGDRFIVSVAEKLKAILKATGCTSLLSRFGGDEFAVFVANVCHPARVIDLAQSICDEIANQVIINGHAISTSLSMGISKFPEDGLVGRDLLRKADLALQNAKKSGRRRFSFYSFAMQEEARIDHLLKSDILRGLSEREFELYYQPIVRLADGGIVGFEGLVRWHHPQKGLLSAGQFAHVLDEPAIAEKMSAVVLEHAVATILDWQAKGREFGTIAINITSAQLRSPLFLQELQHAVEQGILPPHLKLEITEGVLFGRTADKAATTLQDLRDKGFKIALDDFGTGYASLVHLTQFAIDQLKIDMSFVRKMKASESDRTIVQTMCALANGLNLDAVAEGIEDQETEQMLRLMGCRYGQGYLYSKAVSRSEAENFLLSHAAQKAKCS